MRTVRLAIGATLLLLLATGRSMGQSPEECLHQRSAQAACTKYLADRLEIRLTAALNPDALTTSASHHPRPRLNALLQPLGAWLEPSVSPHLAMKYGLTRVYTVRFPAPVNPLAIDQVLKDIRSLTTEVAGAALVPAPRAPGGWDPFVHEADKVVFSPECPECPCGTQWYLHRSGVIDAWKQGASGRGVVVIVADWGFVTDHSELPVDAPPKPGALEMEHAFNACAADKPVFPGPDAAHGAATTGIVGARLDEVGMQGIAFESKIWPTLASCSNLSGNPCEGQWGPGNPWAEAIVHAIDEPSQERRKVLLLEVQSCCEGNYEASLAVEEAIDKAVEKGVVVVLAGGNGNRDAGCDEEGNVISRTGGIVVGATTYAKENQLDPRSNYGERIDIAAPGDAGFDLTLATQQFACKDTPYRKSFGGTSGAAAKVAGVAALMLQMCPKLPPDQVKTILVEAGDPVFRIDRDPARVDDPGIKRLGGKFLNAGKAVKMAMEACSH